MRVKLEGEICAELVCALTCFRSYNDWCRQVFAHRGNLLRHMALHDPENPANKDLLAEAEEEDQAEDYEEEDITLDTPGPLIQTVSGCVKRMCACTRFCVPQ